MTDPIHPHDPVFPSMPCKRGENLNPEPSGAYFDPGGLTKREYFAAMMLQGRLSCDIGDPDSFAREAVRYADALIVALNERMLADNTAERLAQK